VTATGFGTEGTKLKQQERTKRICLVQCPSNTCGKGVVVETPVDGPTLGQGEKTSSPT
jgi:hypothetical protein